MKRGLHLTEFNKDRRRLIQGFAAAMAATAGGSVTGCAGSFPRPGYAKGSEPYNLHEMLADYRAQRDQLKKAAGFEMLEDHFKACQCNPDIVKDSLEALLALGTYGDLSKADQKTPEGREVIEEALPLLDNVMYCMTTYLENLDAKTLEQVEDELMNHPEVVDLFKEEFHQSARKMGVRENRLEHFEKILDTCAWKMKNQSSKDLIEESIEKVDKCLEREGIHPDLRRQFAQQKFKQSCPEDKPFKFASNDTKDTEETSSDWDLSNSDEQAEKSNVLERLQSNTGFPDDDSIIADTSLTDLETKRALEKNKDPYRLNRGQRIGRSWLIWGLWQFGIGTLLVVSESPLLALGLVLGMTLGAFIIVIGLLIALFASLREHFERSLDKRYSKYPKPKK